MGNGRGMPKPAAACTTTVMPAAWSSRPSSLRRSPTRRSRASWSCLLINHPLDCPICDKGGECPLQNQAMTQRSGRYPVLTTSSGRSRSRSRSPTNVLLDRERCVLCQRCTRFSAQIAGDPFIDLLERGAQQQIGTSDEEPFQSYFSGNTVQICPVGALTGRLLPLPGPPVRPDEHRHRLRTLLVRLRAAQRLASQHDHPALGQRRPRRQRGMELRQGPMGVPQCDATSTA